MGYFTQIMIEAKERYGHILKERNLVMRGERGGGGLTLVFRTRDPNGWRLPVELYVPGKAETRKDRAEWADVQVTAEINTEVKFGDDGWFTSARDSPMVVVIPSFGRENSPGSSLCTPTSTNRGRDWASPKSRAFSLCRPMR